MSDDIRSSICCPSDTPDSPNGDGIWDYRVDRNNPHPPPVVTCPDDFVAWLKEGEYVVPDFSGVITINGLCQVDSEFTITQQPPAGTVIQVGGEVVILIIVIDGHENQVECNFTIDVHDPEDPDTDDPPTVLPPWIYTPYLLFYYTANDTQCTVGALDEGLPCWFRRDVAGLIGLPTHHLSNGGDAVLNPSQSFVAPFSPGPIFNRGSVLSNNVVNGYLYHADDTPLRLLNTDFTIRLAFKLTSMDDGGVWPLVGKYDTVGWRVKVERSGSQYRLSPELRNNSTSIATTYRLINVDTWYYVAITFNAVLGRLRLYLDGQLVEETTSTGFALSGESSQFRIGSQQLSSAACALAYWSLDDNTWADDGPNGFDLTAGVNITNVAGKINNCARGQGNNSDLTHADSAVLRLLGTDFTIRAWFQFVSGSGPCNIVHKTTATNGYRLYMANGLGLVFEMANGGVIDTLSSTAGMFPNVWKHIVVTFNHTTKLASIYLDGVLDSFATFVNNSPGSSANQIRLGDTVSSAIFKEDEVGIFPVAWDAAEVAADYNSGNGTGFMPCTGSGAVVYHDEIGGWTQEWNAARVLEDYTVMTSFS